MTAEKDSEPGLSARIRREARVVGLREFRTPTLEAVEQRRMQLWVLTTVLLLAFSLGVAILTLLPGATEWLGPSALRWGVVALAAAFCAYAIEKELHLRRLSRLLIDERVLTAALSNRLHEVSLLLDAGKAMNSVLELDAVLEVILRSASDLLSARSGSIMLAEDGELVASCVHGNDAAFGRREAIGRGIAGHVALTLEPLLINGRADPGDFPGLEPRTQSVESAMCVPLVHRGELLGVLNVNADPDRVFSEYDLRALSLFAEQAAGAITNAHLYEATRSRVDELVEIDRIRAEFVNMVTHELRTPLTAVIAGVETAQRPEMQADAPDLLDVVQRNARHLAEMIDDLLVSIRLESRKSIGALVPVDAADLARTVVEDFAVSGRPVELDTPATMAVLGQEDALRRLLTNLLDNAYTHGAAPVRVAICHEDGHVALRVSDAGGGIPAAERDRVFERFARLPRSDGKPGLGLGLAIVRGLATTLGGSVELGQSDAGGAEFTVRLRPCMERAEAV